MQAFLKNRVNNIIIGSLLFLDKLCLLIDTAMARNCIQVDKNLSAAHAFDQTGLLSLFAYKKNAFHLCILAGHVRKTFCQSCITCGLTWTNILILYNYS